MAAPQKYVVAEFLEEDPVEVAVVHVSWLFNQSMGSKKCEVYWPPTRNGDKILQMINQDVPADPNTWTSWKVKILYQTDTYSKAKEACRKAEEETDIDYQSEAKGKRKIRPNKRYIDESSSEEEELVAVSNKKKKSTSNQRLPQPPEFTFMSGPSSSQNSARKPPLRRSPRKSPVKSPVASREGSSPRNIHVFQTSPSVQKTSVPELKCLCIKVEALKEEVKANTKLLRQIFHMIKRGREVEEVELPNDVPSLPLSSMEDMTALNDALKDAAKRKYLVSILGKVGGSTVWEAVNRQLQSLMVGELACKFNWKGQRGGKVKFCSLTGVIGVLFDAVRSNLVLRDAKLKEIEEAIKRHLKYAYQRLPRPVSGPKELTPVSSGETVVEEDESE